MTNIKRCSTSVIIREFFFCKIIMKYHLIPIRMVTTKRAENECWQGCRENGTLVRYWWECKMVRLLWKTIWWFLKKLKIWSSNPIIPLLGRYRKEFNAGSQRDICTPMFTALLFIIANKRKLPKCPLMNEQINKI